MDVKRASELITENLHTIHGYAAARLYDRDKAEDLAQEIIVEVFESIGNLRDDNAFWGFVWKIAENTFRKFIRREGLKQKAEQNTDSFSNMETLVPSPEEDLSERTERDDRIYLIRRELSLLTKTRREVTVAYYIRNKSCSQISKELGISVEMVKYHLFKTRKQLKEGLNMTRHLGEKSYDPGIFRINFWGDYNRYNDFFDRKLRGSIALAAYYSPMTAEELSVELGVAMPYLEEEIEACEAAGVLKKNGNKYQTSFVIVTDEYEEEVERKTAEIYPTVAKKLFEDVRSLLPEVRKLDFRGNDYDDNRLMFTLLNMVVVGAFFEAKETSPMAYEYPKLPLGGHGWIWGHDNDFKNVHFAGVSLKNNNADNTVWFSAANYTAILPCQHYRHNRFFEKLNVMCDAILGKPADENNSTIPELIDGGFITVNDGILTPNFAVFGIEAGRKIESMLDPYYKEIGKFMIEVSELCAGILKEHAPAHVKDQCAIVARIHHGLDGGAILIENLLKDGSLYLPKGKVPLGVFGVDQRQSK